MACNKVARVFCALLFGSVGLHGYANTNSDSSNIEFGFDIGVDHQHQEFDTSSANLTTVSFAPRVTMGNWEVSLDLPWQRAQGEYFVNGNFAPTPRYVCLQQALNIQENPRLLTYLLNNPLSKLGQRYAKCQSEAANANAVDDSVSGLSDATLLLRYALPLDADGTWLFSAVGGYKFDNGDYQENLGSGTRNTIAEASLGASYRWFIGSITAGYTWISATDATDTESNYTYAIVDAGIRPLDWLTIGCNWSSNGSYYAETDTVQKTTAYVRVKPIEHVGLKLYISDYGNADYYPDREYGASIFYSY